MHIIKLLYIIFFMTSCNSYPTSNSPKEQNKAMVLSQKINFYDFELPSLLDGEAIRMNDYRGKKILLVNVASRCGYTSQYSGLQQLHETYGNVVQVIGIPCNQFMGQEPGTSKEIAQFCSNKYRITFPITQKIAVKGENQHPLYHWLTSKEENNVGNFSVSWNFNKFLIDEKGNLMKHFGSGVKPMSQELLSAIDI